MLKRRNPRLTTVAVLIALIIGARGTPVGSDAIPPGGSTVASQNRNASRPTVLRRSRSRN